MTNQEQTVALIAKEAGIISKKDFRKKIIKFQKQFENWGAKKMKDFTKPLADNEKLEHEFGEGTYIRKITMPAGHLYLSQIHKITHPFFVMEGEATVISDEGVVKITAPYYGMTKPGTQRILYIHKECVWITVHPTDKKTVEEVVEDVIAKDYNDQKLKLT